MFKAKPSPLCRFLVRLSIQPIAYPEVETLMMLTTGQVIAIALSAQLPQSVTAQDSLDKVWGVFAYTIFGDSTPDALAQSQPKVLSDYGASQLAAAGSAFRYRYVVASGSNESDTSIQNISPSILQSKQVDVYTTAEQYTVASAQAFMNGLYPPLGLLDMNKSDETANGTMYTSPLDGYQFPKILTLGASDPGSLAVSGQSSCNMYYAARSEYQNSKEAQDITNDSKEFYSTLWDKVLVAAFDQSSATYANAIEIADYLNYEYLHNVTAWEHITDGELRQARNLADRFSYAVNGHGASTLSQSNIGLAAPIAGQTLATSILSAFRMNIEEKGKQGKMNLLFGGDEGPVALSSLIGLATSQQSNFFSRPARGASLIFELYSIETDEIYPSYPSSDQLYVRFFLHNGTDSSTEFYSYPLFGHGPSRTYIPWSDFEQELETFAISSVKEWCVQCNADTIFCDGVLDSSDSSSNKKKGVSPAVAGVIGAVVTLAVIGMLAALGFFLCIFPNRKTRKPSMGGFKGTRKLASDTDLSFRNPIWGASKTANSEQQHEIPAAHIRGNGHERLGSWEMGEQKTGLHEGQPSANQQVGSALDEEPDELDVHSGMRPVRERESI